MKQIKRSEFIGTALTGTKDPGPNSGDRTTPANHFANKTTPSFDSKAMTGIEEYTGKFGQLQLYHLLRRTLFGVTMADLQYFDGMTLDQVVAALLTPTPTPMPPVNAYNTNNFTDPDVPLGQTWVNAAYGTAGQDPYRVQSFKNWWVGLMLNQDRSITEKMTLFWSNHFATQCSVVDDARYSYKTNALQRSFALGNFKTLSRQITTDPGMLVYLNGDTNTKNNPNENYGRELQERFTVGYGPDSLYTQGDVEAAAQALSGWKDVKSTISSAFTPSNHTTTNKQFSAFYNSTLIDGLTGSAGATETDQLIEMIFAQVETAKFLCRNLYRWFIYYVIDDQVEANVIAPLANVVVQNNFEMVPVLSTLLKSTHFFDPNNMGCQIKNPVDHLVGLCRQFNITFPGPSNITTQYKGWQLIDGMLSSLALGPGEPPNVAGFPAYYQEPQFHELWINSDTLPLRNEYTSGLSSQNGITQGGVTLVIDILGFTELLSNPSDPNQLIAQVSALLSPNDLGSVQTAFLKSTLLSGLSNDAYWTAAWDQYIAAPTNTTYKNTVLSRLIPMYSYILSLAEYQLI